MPTRCGHTVANVCDFCSPRCTLARRPTKQHDNTSIKLKRQQRLLHILLVERVVQRHHIPGHVPAGARREAHWAAQRENIVVAINFNVNRTYFDVVAANTTLQVATHIFLLTNDGGGGA